jgi:hypothetical protein
VLEAEIVYTPRAVIALGAPEIVQAELKVRPEGRLGLLEHPVIAPPLAVTVTSGVMETFLVAVRVEGE